MALRFDLIKAAINQAQFATRGKNSNDKYEGMIQLIEANCFLTNKEKEKAKQMITFDKDIQNLMRLKGPTYECSICKKVGLTISFCEHCVHEKLQSNFTTWTSGNDVIN